MAQTLFTNLSNLALERMTEPSRSAQVEELLHWAWYLDSGPDSSVAQRRNALDGLREVSTDPDLWHSAWVVAVQRLSVGETTRSVVALLAQPAAISVSASGR